MKKEKIGVEKKIISAEAEKRANELNGHSLTDNIIREKIIEKWNGELPKVTDNSFVFDISSLFEDK